MQNISRTGAAITGSSTVHKGTDLGLAVEAHTAIKARVIGNENGLVRIQFNDLQNAVISKLQREELLNSLNDKIALTGAVWFCASVFEYEACLPLWRRADKFKRILMNNELAAVCFGDLPRNI